MLAIAPAPASVSSSPTAAAELAETVLFDTVIRPPRLLLSALPVSVAKLLDTVESRRSTSPPTSLSIAPPALPATLPVRAAALNETLAVLLLTMAPPYSAALPSRKVRPGERDRAAVDRHFEEAIEPMHLCRRPAGRIAPVHDGRAGAGPTDGEAVGDVEVARGDVVLVQGRNAELVGAGGKLNVVRAGKRVRFLDRGAERARPGNRPTRPVADAGVDASAVLPTLKLTPALGDNDGLEDQHGANRECKCKCCEHEQASW